jgi:hypothetical protein
MPDDTMVFVDDTGIVPRMADDWPSFHDVRDANVKLFLHDGRWARVGYINLDTGEITNAS